MAKSELKLLMILFHPTVIRIHALSRRRKKHVFDLSQTTLKVLDNFGICINALNFCGLRKPEMLLEILHAHSPLGCLGPVGVAILVRKRLLGPGPGPRPIQILLLISLLWGTVESTRWPNNGQWFTPLDKRLVCRSFLDSPIFVPGVCWDDWWWNDFKLPRWSWFESFVRH